tara:strand:- start:480 stop:755 length:276 start_codon:yes stop_codon:yes gene_type:complete
MNKHFRLKEALKQRKKITGKFMSQQEFAEKIFPDHNPKTALYHVNMALNGHAYGRFSPDVVVKACKVLKCEPNFLFNYSPKKQINEQCKNK